MTDALASGHASAYPTGAGSYHLALWHGVGPPLLLSLLTLAVGTGLHLARRWVAGMRSALPAAPDAGRAQDLLASLVLAVARGVTRRTQIGSLPGYLFVILLVVSLGPGAVLVVLVGLPDQVRLWDGPFQAFVGAAVALAVAGVVTARRRLTAVLLLSAVGYLVAALFVFHGAPDLALTQVLVETLTLLVFVLVIRRMPDEMRAPPIPLRRLRAVAAVLVGGFATLATLAAGAQHVPSRSTEGYFRHAQEAGGPNVVNVIITEFRAIDTLGEITVVAIAATGVASLVLVSTRLGGARRPSRRRTARSEAEQAR